MATPRHDKQASVSTSTQNAEELFKNSFTILHGYLKKRSPPKMFNIRRWQDRYFVLEKTKLVYYKTEKMYTSGERPQGVIHVQDIRGVSLPSDDREGCRFDLEISSQGRRIFELMAATDVECQKWCSLLSLLCHNVPHDEDEDGESDGDEITTSPTHNGNNKKPTKNRRESEDGSDMEEEATKGPLIPPHKLIQAPAEVIREMDQFSLSVTLDLFGPGADKIATRIVLFTPVTNTSSSNSSPLAVALKQATASSPLTLPVPSPTSTSSPTNASRSTLTHQSSLDHNGTIEGILNDPQLAAELLEFCKKIFCEEYCLFYWALQKYKSCPDGSESQKIAARNLYDTYVKNGAEFEINTQATTRESIHAAIESGNLHKNTFESLYRHVMSLMRVDFLPKYLSSFKPENGTSTTSQQSSLTTPATPTRKTSNERGRTLTYNNVNSAVLKGWEEASRTDTVLRPNGAKRAYADWFDGDDSERRFFSVLLLTNVDLYKSDHCLPRIRFLNRGGVFDGNVDRASRRKRMEQMEMERRLNGNAGTFTLPADADEWLDDGLDAVIAGPDIRLLRFIVYRVNDAAEEDISTHVMIGAVQVSLKEILCGDNGEIKQNINFAQSHSELTGHMRIMFQQRRRVRISNNSRYLHRSYVFRDIHDRDLICHETLQESPFTFSMPHASLRRACLEFRRKRRMLLSEIRRIQKDVQKSKYPLEEEMAKKGLVVYLQKRSKLYASVIVRWEKLVKLYDNYDGCYKALRFKPSRDKSDQPLNFVPINLHVQNFQVTHTGRSRCRREKATSSAPTPVISSTQQQQQAQQSQLSPLSPTTPSHRTVSPQLSRSGASTPVATPISSETHGTAPTPLILPSAAPIPRARRGKDIIDTKSAHRKYKGDLAPSEEMLEEIEHVQEKILTKYGRHVVKREKHEDVMSEIGSLDLRRYSEDDGLETLDAIPPPDSPPPEAPTSPDQTPTINANIGSPTSPLHLPSPSPRTRLTKPEDKISPRLALTTTSTNFSRGKSLNATANLGAMLAADRQASTIRLNLGGSKRAGSMSTPSKKEEQMELARQRDKARAEEREREQKERERSMMSDDSSAVERPRYKRKRERKADDTSYETVAYTTTTVGAFVQHAGGLKSGGMTKFLVQLKALQQKRSSEKLKTIMDEFSSSTSKKMYKMAAIAQQRQEVLFSQAITAITTTFVADLMTHIYEPDHLKRMAAAGFLCQIESLLSTFSGEQHMLSDFWFAVKSLEKVKFAIAEQKTPPNNHLASPTSSSSNSSSSSRSTNGHSSHPSHSGHHINETFQRDMDSVTIQITTRSPFLHQIQQTSQNISIPIMKSGRGLELFRSNKSICDPHKRIVSINQYTPINPIVVVILLPSHLYALIPSVLKPDPRHTNWEIAVQSVQLQTPPTPVSSQPSLQRAVTTPTINVNAAIKPLPNFASTPAAKITPRVREDAAPPPPPPMTDRTISDDDSSSEDDDDDVQITNAFQDGKHFDVDDDDAVPPPPSEPVPEDLSDSSTDYEEDDLEAELDDTTPTVRTKSLEKTKKPINPKDVESDELEILSPLIQLFPVMITQGINEMQSVANKMGRHQLQQEINKYGIQQLKAYYKDFVRFAMAEKNRGGNKSYADPDYLAGILEDITAIEAMIGNTAGEKNVLLLQLAGDVSRRMLGGRVVCCKSAKDRTSMSVTWEQARIMYEEHGLMDSELQTAMNLMRLEGVRRANVLKNTGHTAYAFNLLQRSLLPQVFRPPEMACSASTQS